MCSNTGEVDHTYIGPLRLPDLTRADVGVRIRIETPIGTLGRSLDEEPLNIGATTTTQTAPRELLAS